MLPIKTGAPGLSDMVQRLRQDMKNRVERFF